MGPLKYTAIFHSPLSKQTIFVYFHCISKILYSNFGTLAEKYIFKHACYSKIKRLLFLISRTCMPQCGILFHRCLFILEILIGSAILIYFVNKLILKGRKPMRRRQTAGKTPKESNAGDERVRGMVQQDGVPRGWHVLSVSTLIE